MGNIAQTGGVEVSLRAVVGDGQSIKLLVDIIGQSGRPLAIKQADGTLSTRELFFGDVTLERVGGKPAGGGAQGALMPGVSYRSEIIDQNPADNKTTMFCSLNIQNSPVNGETYRLQLRDLMQIATQSGSAIDMEPDALYQLVSQFGGHTDADFIKSGYHEQTRGGAMVYDDLLSRHTDKSVALSAGNPGVKVTNAAVRDGCLYLLGRADSRQALDKITNVPALVSGAGRTAPWDGPRTGDGTTDIEWGYPLYRRRVGGTAQGACLVNGRGRRSLPGCQGNLGLYDSTKLRGRLGNTKNRPRNHLGRLPVTGQVAGSVALYALPRLCSGQASGQRMIPSQPTEGVLKPGDWLASPRAITLTLKDGSTLQAKDPVDNPTDSETVRRLTYALDEVIDPTQVSGVQLGGQTIKMGE